MNLPNYTGHLTPEEIRRIKRSNRGTIWFLLLLALGTILITICVQAQVPVETPQRSADFQEHKARVKDISSIEGIRDNQLMGYGLVVGLAGTGDSQQTTFPTQTLAAMLLRMGVSVPASSIKVQNLAAVFVSATLPPFARPGTKLDITASSAGDAKSLEGGLLLMTPLYGTDG